MSSDDKVLSYFDVVLRRGDINLLNGPNWLNDQVIAFYFEFLTKEYFSDISDQILLVPGAVTYLLTSAGPGIAPIVLDPLDFSNKSLVLFALNNNPDVSAAAGGSHWSLVCYTRNDNTLRHYDSCKGTNSHAAKLLYTALLPLVTSLHPTASLKLVESSDDGVGGVGGFSCPQQENNYDCGMMVLAIAELLCHSFRLLHSSDSLQHMDFRIKAKDVGARELNKKRQEIHSLILEKSRLEQYNRKQQQQQQ